MQAFEIRILSQEWLEPDGRRLDPCSHGTIQLIIGGEVIEDGANQYGIRDSALALLRTLDSNHSQKQPLAQRLIFHGCSIIPMFNCEIGIDWKLEHLEGEVLISDVIKYPSNDPGQKICFAKLSAQVPEKLYRGQVLRFAAEAREFFKGVSKHFDNDSDRRFYNEFWMEYNRRMERWQRPQPPDLI